MAAKERTYTPEELGDLLRELPGWEHRDGAIRRAWETAGWSHTMLVVNAVAFVCEAADHHPDLAVGWNRVEVAFHTHSAGGITRKDVEAAALVDRTVLWAPGPDSALTGPPKPFVRG
jgi:4a-hydroxytetrahydrobiopterin dehydratase